MPNQGTISKDIRIHRFDFDRSFGEFVAGPPLKGNLSFICGGVKKGLRYDRRRKHRPNVH